MPNFLMLCLWSLISLLSSSSSLYAAEKKVSLGSPVSEGLLRNFDQIISVDGSGLPDGSGTAAQGEEIYQMKCLACHGAKGEGASGATRIAGGSLHADGNPVRTVGSYWPYATTIFDFVRRAMPADAPKSLTDLEVYKVTAYILYLNGIVEKDFPVDKSSLPAIKMPNRDGFIDRSSEH